jgi:hypothetical protein
MCVPQKPTSASTSREWATGSRGLPDGAMHGGDFVSPMTDTVAVKARQEPWKPANEARVWSSKLRVYAGLVTQPVEILYLQHHKWPCLAGTRDLGRPRKWWVPVQAEEPNPWREEEEEGYTCNGAWKNKLSRCKIWISNTWTWTPVRNIKSQRTLPEHLGHILQFLSKYFSWFSCPWSVFVTSRDRIPWPVTCLQLFVVQFALLRELLY